jgi:hypothetical protein
MNKWLKNAISLFILPLSALGWLIHTYQPKAFLYGSSMSIHRDVLAINY